VVWPAERTFSRNRVTISPSIRYSLT